MATLNGRTYTRAELLKYTGDIAQIAGVDAGELADGFERGVRTARVHTGTGFDFTVLVDRGFDIGPATYAGASLAYRSPTGAPAPAFYEPDGPGWLRGFFGGLVVTCGLSYFGAAGVDEGKPLGVHGRASYLPATHFAYGGDWHGDDYEVWVSGQTREVAFFGENLLLQRRISARLGESRLFIDDVVTNEGFDPAPHMLLYHCNLGFPVLDENSEMLCRAESRPRDPEAVKGVGQNRRFQPPTAGYKEQVFYHDPAAGPDGFTGAALVNRAFGGGQGLGVYLRFRPDQLPHLIEWKMVGEGFYVCGLEPGTNEAGGRAVERAAGRLQYLAPGESRRYHLEIGVLPSVAAIDAFAAALAAD
jgi:hypothetical protein